MTFRIDYVRCRKGVWSFSIKGIEGAGVYGTLQTNFEGRGLYLENPEARTAGGKLISPNEFGIPADASEEQAIRLLAACLQNLGWGPEVDKHNRLREASSDKESATQFGAATSLTKQASCRHDWQPDGQTLTATRWTCSKCFKTELR